MRQSCMPSKAMGWCKFSSTMTLSACLIKEGEFPIAVVGISEPSSVIARASTIAISTFGIAP